MRVPKTTESQRYASSDGLTGVAILREDILPFTCWYSELMLQKGGEVPALSLTDATSSHVKPWLSNAVNEWTFLRNVSPLMAAFVCNPDLALTGLG